MITIEQSSGWTLLPPPQDASSFSQFSGVLNPGEPHMLISIDGHGRRENPAFTVGRQRAEAAPRFPIPFIYEQTIQLAVELLGPCHHRALANEGNGRPYEPRLSQTSPYGVQASDDSAIASCGAASGVSGRQQNGCDVEDWLGCANAADGPAAIIAIKKQRRAVTTD